MNAPLHHRCRNPRCKMKLPAPVENSRRAFCTRGCFNSFYRTKCRVCERDITLDPMSGQRRSLSAHRQFCGRKCKAEAARFPRVYRWGEPPPRKSPASARTCDISSAFLAISDDRPAHHCLRAWRWGGDPDQGDHSLYNKDGLTIARIVLAGDGRYHLRSPITWPRMSWPDLERAKRGAEAMALVAMPLASVDPKLAARIKRDNETPHPMGPPLNLRPTPWMAPASNSQPHSRNGSAVWRPGRTAHRAPPGESNEL